MVRRWQRSDLSTIRQVAWDTWTSAYGAFIPEADRRAFHSDYYSMEKLQRLYDSDSIDGCVAMVDDKIVGYSKTHWIEVEDQFFITSLYILPEFQKQNLGKEMLHFGISNAKQQGTKKVWLGVMVENKPAIEWYLRQGFVFIENRPFTIGLTTVDDLIGYKLI